MRKSRFLACEWWSASFLQHDSQRELVGLRLWISWEQQDFSLLSYKKKTSHNCAIYLLYCLFQFLLLQQTQSRPRAAFSSESSLFLRAVIIVSIHGENKGENGFPGRRSADYMFHVNVWRLCCCTAVWEPWSNSGSGGRVCPDQGWRGRPSNPGWRTPCSPAPSDLIVLFILLKIILLHMDQKRKEKPFGGTAWNQKTSLSRVYEPCFHRLITDSLHRSPHYSVSWILFIFSCAARPKIIFKPFLYVCSSHATNPVWTFKSNSISSSQHCETCWRQRPSALSTSESKNTSSDVLRPSLRGWVLQLQE